MMKTTQWPSASTAWDSDTALGTLPIGHLERLALVVRCGTFGGAEVARVWRALTDLRNGELALGRFCDTFTGDLGHELRESR
jgi:hypothetical protein